MATRRRWLQFSLKAFLVVMTVGCVWLGWKVERARRRGRAIDAIVAAGRPVLYMDAPDDHIHPSRSIDHFWPDLRGSRVRIFLAVPLNSTLASQISQIDGVGRIDLIDEHTDDELQYLDGVKDGCHISIHDIKNLSMARLKRLQRRFPHSTIEYHREYLIGYNQWERLTRPHRKLK
jgi:hypothetical protein